MSSRKLLEKTLYYCKITGRVVADNSLCRKWINLLSLLLLRFLYFSNCLSSVPLTISPTSITSISLLYYLSCHGFYHYLVESSSCARSIHLAWSPPLFFHPYDIILRTLCNFPLLPSIPGLVLL